MPIIFIATKLALIGERGGGMVITPAINTLGQNEIDLSFGTEKKRTSVRD